MGLCLLTLKTLAILNTKVSEVMLNQDPFSQTLPLVSSHLSLTGRRTRLLSLEPHRAVSLNCCPLSDRDVVLLPVPAISGAS